MDGLMLHCGANRVERDAVYNVKTPEPTDTHFPVPHTLLLEEVEKNLKANGYEIIGQAHALTGEGMRYFGLLEVKLSGAPCMDEPMPGTAWDYAQKAANDYGLVIGMRNAHDQTYCAALAMGNRVFVCDNLSFSGEVLIGRRHTRHIERDIPMLIPRAFSALSVERVNMETRIDAYKEAGISDKDAHDFIVRAIVDERIFPKTKLADVVQEWRKPAHEEFEPRTVWSLANAFTEVAKPRRVVVDGVDRVRGGNPGTLMARTSKLYGFFDKTLGVSLKSRDEVLSEGAPEGAVTGYAVAHNSR